MRLDRFKESYDQIANQATQSRKFLIIFIVIIVVLVGLLASKKPVVTVVPWTLQSQAQIFEDNASQSYKEAWALAISILIGNVQPNNVGFIAERLKPILAPKIYHQTIDAIHANAQQLRDERVTLRFEPRQVIYEKSTDKLFVNGYSFTRLGTSLEGETRSERTYEMHFEIDTYAPMLTYISTYSGEPLTRDAIEKAEKEKQRALERKRRQAERDGVRFSRNTEEE